MTANSQLLNLPIVVRHRYGQLVASLDLEENGDLACVSATQVRHFQSSPLKPIFSKASWTRFQAVRSVQQVNWVCDEDRDHSRSRDNPGYEGSGRWRGFG